METFEDNWHSQVLPRTSMDFPRREEYLAPCEDQIVISWLPISLLVPMWFMLCLRIKPKYLQLLIMKKVMISDTHATFSYRWAELCSIIITTSSREKLKNPGKLVRIDSPSVLSSFELLDDENGSSIFLRNIDNYLSVDMA